MLWCVVPLQVTGVDSIAAVQGAVYIKYNAMTKVRCLTATAKAWHCWQPRKLPGSSPNAAAQTALAAALLRQISQCSVVCAFGRLPAWNHLIMQALQLAAAGMPADLHIN
jgi:hypothetical protein